MANFFSKYFSELALMATAVLWAGCGDVDKDSKNEKSLNASNSFGVTEISNSVESSDSAVLQSVTGKDDSLDANSQTVVLLDSAKLLEKQRTRDSLMKAFFPIERTRMEKKWGLRYDIGRMLSYGTAKRRDSVFANLKNIRTKVSYYGVIESPSNGPVNDFFRSWLGNTIAVKLRGTVKVLYKNIEIVNKQTLDQDMYSRVTLAIRQRTSGLRHLYGKFLKKNPNNSFEGEITLKLTIAADGTVKKSSIEKSTTGVKSFDEEIRNAASRWIFPKFKSGKTVVYVPIHFYEEDKTSSQPK